MNLLVIGLTVFPLDGEDGGLQFRRQESGHIILGAERIGSTQPYPILSETPSILISIEPRQQPNLAFFPNLAFLSQLPLLLFVITKNHIFEKILLTTVFVSTYH
jgi:hypothetical protein